MTDQFSSKRSVAANTHADSVTRALSDDHQKRISANDFVSGWDARSETLPGKDELIELLNSSQHAPQETHNKYTGECSECPWPLYALGVEEIAQAIANLINKDAT